MSKNIIELNGKRYDALTGTLLGASHARVNAPLTPTVPIKRRVIDGFMRSTAPVPVLTQHNKPVIDPGLVVKKPSTPAGAHSRAHAVAKSADVHKPQHAKTLMRRTVHKPVANRKPNIKAQIPAEIAPKTASAIAVKHSVARVDPRRQAHAIAVAQHSAVRRFPAVQEIHAISGSLLQQPLSAVPVITVQPAPVSVQHQASTIHLSATPKKDMFEAAIAHATSHEQPAPKRRRSHHRRLVNTMAGVGAFIVIGSFFAWLNMPAIQLHVASIQAGFKAEIPNYKPTGYAMQGGVQRFGNTVSMSFRSGSGHYNLMQQPSDWTSQTLLENTLALTGDHQTLDVGGRTVYVYGNGNAVWVDGGVRYDLTGDAALNADDITHVVSSL